MLDEVENDAVARMQKSVSAFSSELARVRTGRPSPALIEHVRVPYHGSDVALNQIATIGVADARTLSVSPWEKSVIPAVEKAILGAGLGFNPVSAGEIIRVPVPPLTEERRRDLIRVVRQEAETARVAIRNIRRDANQMLKELLREKEITEDEDRRGATRVQSATDRFVAQIDELLKKKEVELLDV